MYQTNDNTVLCRYFEKPKPQQIQQKKKLEIIMKYIYIKPEIAIVKTEELMSDHTGVLQTSVPIDNEHEIGDDEDIAAKENHFDNEEEDYWY